MVWEKDTFEITHELFLLKGSAQEERTKLFLDLQVISRKQEITTKILEQALLEYVPAELLDVAVLADVASTLREADRIEKRRIAKGRLPRQGIDGKLVFLKRKLSKSPQIGGDASDAAMVSLKDLGLFENIRVGEVVARIYHPKPGEPGLTVFGGEIPAPSGAPAPVSIDEKTLTRESGEKEQLPYDKVVASVDGYLEQQGQKLTLRERFVVPGDLDGEFGNLQFVGAIEVRGDVLAGFIVDGEKGVFIKGNVNRSDLRSTHGPIEVKGRFFGEGRGKIVGGQSVSVRSIQDGTIDAFGDIYVQEEVRASTLRTRATIQAGKAHILGGKIYAVLGGVFGDCGSTEMISTEFYLGSEVEMSEDYQTLLVKIEQHEKALELVNAHLGPFATNPARVQLLPSNLRVKMEALLAKKQKVVSSLESLVAKQTQMLAEVKPVDQRLLSVNSYFYPGAVIHSEGTPYCVGEPLKGPLTICFKTDPKEYSQIDYVQIDPVFQEEKKK